MKEDVIMSSPITSKACEIGEAQELLLRIKNITIKILVMVLVWVILTASFML